MCIFIAVLMLIVLYALLGKLETWVLVEQLDNVEWLRVNGGTLLYELWPVWSFAFLAGVLAVLLGLKLLPSSSKDSSS